MATAVLMRHRQSGLVKTGFVGFSWTTFFFGSFPALFRGDFLTFIGSFVVYFLIAVVTLGIGGLISGFVWAFFYNGYYTRKLLERGYEFADSEVKNELARQRLGVVPVRN